MAENEDGNIRPENEGPDAELKAWRAWRAQLLGVAQHVCDAHDLRDSALLEDRLYGALADIRRAEQGKFFISDDTSGDFITKQDKDRIAKLKEKAIHLQDHFNAEMGMVHWSPQAIALKLALKEYITYLDNIQFHYRSGSGNRHKNIRFFVHRLAQAWTKLAYSPIVAWKNKEKHQTSKFYCVLDEICCLIGLQPPLPSSVGYYLNSASLEKDPFTGPF